jgi:hypothetical protein
MAFMTPSKVSPKAPMLLLQLLHSQPLQMSVSLMWSGTNFFPVIPQH